MSSSESLSFLKVIGDDDFERHSERRCLQSRQSLTEKNNRFVDRLLLWKRSRYRYVCAVCATIVFIVCGLTLMLSNEYNRRLSPINTSAKKERLSTNGSDFDELPLSPFEQAVMVDTTCGKVIGTVEDGAFAFKVSTSLWFLAFETFD